MSLSSARENAPSFKIEQLNFAYAHDGFCFLRSWVKKLRLIRPSRPVCLNVKSLFVSTAMILALNSIIQCWCAVRFVMKLEFDRLFNLHQAARIALEMRDALLMVQELIVIGAEDRIA